MGYWIISGVILAGSILWLKNYQKKVARIPKGRKIMMILGSGGHTGEILNLVGHLSPTFQPRVYVAASNDPLSMQKAKEQEFNADPYSRASEYQTVMRIRNVGEKFYWVLLRLPLVLLESVQLVWKNKPDAIICNGPGICVPICLVAYLMKTLGILKTRIMFVESICRVRDVSVTGHFLIWLVDDFFVQWEELKDRCRRDYPGRQVLCYGPFQKCQRVSVVAMFD